jgi:TonB family protein
VIIFTIMKINNLAFKKNKYTGKVIALTGLFASAILHAAIIGGIVYASGLISLSGKTAAKISQISASQYALLPDVEIISDASVLKHGNDAKMQSVKKEDFGAIKAEPISGGDGDKSVFMYRDEVKRMIQEARFYPDDARKEGTQGSVEVSFAILPDGTLGQVSLVKSSGREVLDEEAVSTIKRASPFPAYAGSINNPKIDMQVAIVFKLN